MRLDKINSVTGFLNLVEQLSAEGRNGGILSLYLYIKSGYYTIPVSLRLSKPFGIISGYGRPVSLIPFLKGPQVVRISHCIRVPFGVLSVPFPLRGHGEQIVPIPLSYCGELSSL